MLSCVWLAWRSNLCPEVVLKPVRGRGGLVFLPAGREESGRVRSWALDQGFIAPRPRKCSCWAGSWKQRREGTTLLLDGKREETVSLWVLLIVVIVTPGQGLLLIGGEEKKWNHRACQTAFMFSSCCRYWLALFPWCRSDLTCANCC